MTITEQRQTRNRTRSGSWNTCPRCLKGAGVLHGGAGNEHCTGEGCTENPISVHTAEAMLDLGLWKADRRTPTESMIAVIV